MTFLKTVACLALSAALASCATTGKAGASQSAFFERLTNICGKAFAGKLISNDAADADLAGKAMVMHVAGCNASEIKIPFHIETAPGEWNRSRTWIISRIDFVQPYRPALRLKHDHRHKDGTSDEVTMYGGDTANQGTASRQEFPVDAESIALFQRTGLTASVTNIWSVEVDDSKYIYELRREGRLFRAEFDLTKPIATPPLPWGWEKSPAS